MADLAKFLQGGGEQEPEPIFQDWLRKQAERERQPVWEYEGVEPAQRAVEAHAGKPWYAPLATFGVGFGDAFPPIRAPLDNKVYGSSDPEMQRLSHELMWARMNNPRSYYAGLGLGLAPGAAVPKFGAPWAAYVLGSDPGVQRSMREYEPPTQQSQPERYPWWGWRQGADKR